MNETTLFLVLVCGPLSGPEYGSGEFMLSLTEATRVEVIQGTLEYDRRERFRARADFGTQNVFKAGGATTTRERVFEMIMDVNDKDEQAYFESALEMRKTFGKYEFTKFLLDYKQTIDFEKSVAGRRTGLLDKTYPLVVESDAKTGQVMCLTMELASPPKDSWVKAPHAVSIVFKWNDKEPDPARFVIPAVDKK
jgi:hypothetical protein